MNSATGDTHPILLGTLIALLGSSTAFTFGFLKARLGQANEDYKGTKAKLRPQRKAYWLLWWAAVKVGFWVVVVGFILAVWVWREAKAEK